MAQYLLSGFFCETLEAVLEKKHESCIHQTDTRTSPLLSHCKMKKNMPCVEVHDGAFCAIRNSASQSSENFLPSRVKLTSWFKHNPSTTPDYTVTDRSFVMAHLYSSNLLIPLQLMVAIVQAA